MRHATPPMYDLHHAHDTGRSPHQLQPHRPTSGNFVTSHGQHMYNGMASPSSCSQYQYGPGDWQPDPRSASLSPHPDSSGSTQMIMHGHSAPVTPYALRSMTPQHDGPSPMSRSWTMGMTNSSQNPPPQISFSAFTPEAYTSPLPHTPARGVTSWSEIGGSPSNCTPQYRLNSEGRNRIRRPHGPPPKAVLGGVGGKTWDELQLANRSVSAPTPSQSGTAQLNNTSDPGEMKQKGDGIEKDDKGTKPSFKGNPIIFRPPFPTYSPPDSPELSKEDDVDHEGEGEEITPQPKVSRKEAFPWPVTHPRGPPETIRLPLSPTDTTMKGRRRRIRTGASRELVDDGEGEASGSKKQVAVSVPDPNALARLKAIAMESRRQKANNTQQSAAAEEEQGMDNTPADSIVPVKPALHPSLPPKPPSTHARAPSDQHTLDIDREQRATPASPPSSCSGQRVGVVRLNDSAFVKRQLGTMIKERTKSADGVPVEAGNSHDEPANASLATGDEEKSEHVDGLATAKVADLETDKAAVDEGSHASITVADVQTVDNEEQQTATDATEGQDKIGDSAQRPSKPDTPEEEDIGLRVPTTQQPGNASNESPEPARKRKMKLGALDGYLGRQLGVSGLLDPVNRTKRKVEPEEPKEIDEDRGSSKHAQTEGVETDVKDTAICPSTTTIPTDGAKKRSHSELYDSVPAGHDAKATVASLPRSKLRADAGAFMPGSMGVGSTFKSVPEGQRTFNFGAAPDAGSSSDRAPAVIPLRHSAAVFLPRLPLITPSEPLPAFERTQTPQTPGEAPPPRTEASPSLSAKVSDGTGNGGSIEDGSQVVAKDEVQESPQSRETSSPGSPAAEMHGIYASSPALSVPDDELFYRPPESEISDTAHDELDPESFDPVSYSYDPIADGVFDVFEFHTSTPRRDHSHLPSGSSEEFHSSPEQLLPQSPLIAVAGPGNGDDRQKFRDWVFPLSEHDHRPSISRRHTFDNQHNSATEGTDAHHGVASTFASRVGDLRAFLAQNIKGDHLRVNSAQDHLTSSRSSVEFPIRSPARRIAVVNKTVVSGSATLVPKTQEESDPVRVMQEELRAAVLSISEKVDGLVRHEHEERGGSSDDLTEQMVQVLTRLDRLPFPPQTDMSTLTSALEQQSTLISSMASLLQSQQGHKSDHLVPLLEGQQAVIDRFAQLDDKNDMLACEIEKMSSGIASRQAAEREPIARQKDLHTIDELRQQIQRMQLDHQRDHYKLQTTLRDLASANDRVATMQSDVEKSASQARQAITVKAELEAHHRRLQDDNARLHADLEAAQRGMEEERKRNETATEASTSLATEMNQLRQLTTGMQEGLMKRLAGMEQMQQDRQDNPDFVELREKNARLEKELATLLEKRRADVEGHNSERLDVQAHKAELEKLHVQLEHERQLRGGWEERSGVLEGYLRQEREYRTEAEATARERTYVADLLEARIMSLIEDNHHWRSFAMSYDRKAYREYMKSNPFKGVEPTEIQRPNGHSTVEEGSKETEGILMPGRTALGTGKESNVNGAEGDPWG